MSGLMRAYRYACVLVPVCFQCAGLFACVMVTRVVEYNMVFRG